MGLREDTWRWLQPALQDMRSGTDQPWDERRAKLLEQLGLTNAEQHPVVADLLHRLDTLPDQERTATVDSDSLDATAYELVQAHVPDDQSAPAAGYDDHAWQTFLATNGPTWDGTAESWPAFRQWFEHYAAEQGLAAAATALFEYLETQSVSERVATFASYGVTVAATATHETQPGSAGGEFDWVTEEQAGKLTKTVGADWQPPLNQELTTRWGADWQTHPAEHKTAWLADLIESGQLAKSPEEELAELSTLIDNLPDYDKITF